MTVPLKALKLAKKAYAAHRKARMRAVPHDKWVKTQKALEIRSTDKMIKIANTKSQSKVLKPIDRAIKRAKKIKNPAIREYGLDKLKGKRMFRKDFHGGRKGSIFYKGHKRHKNMTFSVPGKIGAG